MPSRLSSSLLAGAAALALLFSACGGGDDGRPSADDIKDAIVANDDSGTDEETASCIADALHDSDISDSGLRKLIDSPDVEDINDIDLSDDDQQAAQSALTDALGDCIGDIPDLGDATSTTEAEG